MKHIFLNLKRFDISSARGGVNRLAPMADWGRAIVTGIQEALRAYHGVDFVAYLPEAHLLTAAAARAADSPLRLGCQGVHRADTAVGGAFGAFTTGRTANAARELGATSALIGHCEERADKLGILAEAGVTGPAAAEAVNRILHPEDLCAQAAGLDVLYCVGERSEEQPVWQQVLAAQLQTGLEGADLSRVAVAYEPVWSIGPGKTPADAPYIARTARFIKDTAGSVDVVYGGGLKQENAASIAAIPELDGGLVALTRFTGEIGFYPDEYLDIIDKYMRSCL